MAVLLIADYLPIVVAVSLAGTAEARNLVSCVHSSLLVLGMKIFFGVGMLKSYYLPAFEGGVERSDWDPVAFFEGPQR